MMYASQNRWMLDFRKKHTARDTHFHSRASSASYFFTHPSAPILRNIVEVAAENIKKLEKSQEPLYVKN
jgi:hypothetical protein